MMEVQIIQQNSLYKIKENNDFIFVDLQENRGKANALNQGIKQASYDYVMCCMRYYR